MEESLIYVGRQRTLDVFSLIWDFPVFSTLFHAFNIRFEKYRRPNIKKLGSGIY